MKPYKSFIFLVLVLIFIFGVLAFFMPDRFSELVSKPYIVGSFKGVQGVENKESTKEVNFLAQLKKRDSIIADINARYSLNPKIFGQQDLVGIPLEAFVYDTLSRADSIVKNPLENVYRSLLDLQRNPTLLRFLHYGDSQIENDRITSTFRSLLQRGFGGKGCGMLPLFQSDYQGGISVKLSKNWSVMSMRTNQRRGNYGLCNAYLYPPAINALVSQGNNVESGTIQITGFNSDSGSSEIFLDALLHEDVWVEKDLRLSVNNGAGTGTAAGGVGVKLIKQENSFGLQHCLWKLPSNAKSINLSLRLLKNRNIYALSINSKTGIIVDNLALRGSTGNIFLKNNRRFLMDNYSLMGVRLVIYQFEGAEKDFAFYEKMLQQELSYLRITVPDVPVIVIGATNNTVRKIQRKVALENGCIFWFSEFAEKEGAEYVGKMLYKAFIDDYRKFVIKEKQREISTL